MFEIHTDPVRRECHIFLGIAEELKLKRYDIMEVKDELSSMSGMDEVISALSEIELDLFSESEITCKIGESIAAITEDYDETEDIIYEEISGLMTRRFESLPSMGRFSVEYAGISEDRIDMDVMSELMKLIS